MNLRSSARMRLLNQQVNYSVCELLIDAGSERPKHRLSNNPICCSERETAAEAAIVAFQIKRKGERIAICHERVRCLLLDVAVNNKQEKTQSTP